MNPLEIDEPVHLSAPQPGWAAVFAAEHARLVAALGAPPEHVQHIGSTAVPGLLAKPIVDVMLALPQIPPVPQVQERLAFLGYVALGEAGVPGRFYFRNRGRIHANLHAVAHGGPHWVQNLALREHLTAHAGARERYAAAKRAAVASGATSLLAYSQAKGALLESLLQEALAARNADRQV